MFWLGFISGAYLTGFAAVLWATWTDRQPWPERIVIPLCWPFAVAWNLLLD